MSPLSPLTSQLTVLLFTDLLDSSKLKTQLGDRAYAEQVAAPHNRLFRELLAQFPGAAINNYMGDGFLATFARVSDAVNFALLFHQRLDEAAHSGPMPMTRIGIYVGELITLDDGSIAGHAADMCARLMSLGGGRQTLLTRHVFDDARQHVRVHPKIRDEANSATPELAWQAHGRYEFKGKEDDPLEVFEVGAVGFAPLTAPRDSEKARRKLNADEEATLGWRPAIGQEVPSKPHWVLQKQLGAGGFGEVWLVKHRKTQEEKVFKFCFDADRLRSFKRELTLFRLLRKELGDRPDIAKIHDIRLDQPPFYLELDYAPLGNLQDWVATKKGLLQLPLQQRLDLLARVCDAVEAAHSIDVLHKDLKPSNILMYDDRGETKPRLCDFGIGVLADLTRLENADITRMGFTQTLLAANESSRTGTRLYAPPETLMGQPFTKLGDVYALGVMFFQLVIGKFDQPIAYGWERDIAEGDLTGTLNGAMTQGVEPPGLRSKLEQPSSIARAVYKETIGLAIEGNPTRRVPSAAELARLIRALPTTIDTREAEETARVAELAKKETARRTRVFRIVMGIAASVLAIVGTLGAMSYVQWQRAESAKQEAILAKDQETKAKNDAVAAYAAAELAATNEKQRADETAAVLKFVETRIFAAARPNGQDGGLGKDVTLSNAIDTAISYIEGNFKGQPLIEASLRSTLGKSYEYFEKNEIASLQYEKALKIRRERLGTNHSDTLNSIDRLAAAYDLLDRKEEALLLKRESLRICRDIYGPEKPQTIEAMINVALELLSSSFFAEEAYQLLNYVVQICNNKIKSDDPDKIFYIQKFSFLYIAMFRFNDALSSGKEVYRLSQLKYGPDDWETLAAMQNLSSMHRFHDQHEESVLLLEEALRIIRTKPEANFFSMEHLITSLASGYEDLGRHADAYELRRELLKKNFELRGANHPLTLARLDNLAFSYQQQGKLSDALIVTEERVSLSRGNRDLDIENTLYYMNEVGELYCKLGQYKKAQDLLEEILTIRRKRIGPTDYNTLVTMHQLAETYCVFGRYTEAYQLLDEAYKIDAIKLDAHEIEKYDLALMKCIASIEVTGNIKESVKLIEGELGFMQKLFGEKFSYTIRMSQIYAYALMLNNEYDKGLAVYLESISTLKNTNTAWVNDSDRIRSVRLHAILSKAWKDSKPDEASKHADEAMVLLAEMVANGYTNVTELEYIKDFDSLFERADFQCLVAEMQAKLMEMNETSPEAEAFLKELLAPKDTIAVERGPEPSGNNHLDHTPNDTRGEQRWSELFAKYSDYFLPFLLQF